MENTLHQASAQWASRPADERYTSLHDMLDHFRFERAHSRAVVASTQRIQLEPESDNRGLILVGGNDKTTGDRVNFAPTHYAFGQLAQLAEAPAGYLRTLPSPLAADCINFIYEYDCRLAFFGGCKQIANTGGSHPDKHFHKFGAGN